MGYTTIRQRLTRLQARVRREVEDSEKSETPEMKIFLDEQVAKFEAMSVEEQDAILGNELEAYCAQRLDLIESGELVSLHVLEERAIKFALQFHNGNVAIVARQLGLSRTSLYRKLQEYGNNDGETTS